jgi:hypothetical protein
MECYINSYVYFIGLVGSSVFLYYTYDSLLKLLNNEVNSKLAHIELELELARQEIKQLIAIKTETTHDETPEAETTDDETPEADTD